jgi:hypothetical protein
MFGGRVGMGMGLVMPYALIGYTHADVNWNNPSPLLPGSLEGITYGGRAEFAFPKLPEFTTALEMRWTQYDGVSIGNGVSLQPDHLQAMVRLIGTSEACFTRIRLPVGVIITNHSEKCAQSWQMPHAVRRCLGMCNRWARGEHLLVRDTRHDNGSGRCHTDARTSCWESYLLFAMDWRL